MRSKRSLVVWTVLPVIALAVALVRFARQSRELDGARVALLRSAAALEGEKSHVQELIRLLSSVPVDDTRLHGDTVAVTSRGKEQGRFRLIAVLSPECNACTRILPFLDSLEASFPGAVVGVTFGVPESDVREYVTRASLTFPVIRSPSGELARLLPRHATPVFVLVVGSRIESLDIGVPEPHRAKWLRTRLRELAGAGAASG